MKIWKEFKQFLSSGNILGLAIAVVMGVAFGLVITSFTNDILMQLIAAIGAKPNFGSLAFKVNGTSIRYGAFLTACINFLLVAACMFGVVKAYNRLVPKEQGPAAESERDLLREIRDELRTRRPA
jgi:large conductance mechanosensitive channel